jgi:hypothetical protein
MAHTWPGTPPCDHAPLHFYEGESLSGNFRTTILLSVLSCAVGKAIQAATKSGLTCLPGGRNLSNISKLLTFHYAPNRIEFLTSHTAAIKSNAPKNKVYLNTKARDNQVNLPSLKEAS